MKKSDLVYILALLMPAVIIYRAFFLPGPLAWADAPYFFPEYVKTFVGVPYTWTSWGEEFGRISNILWIHPFMLLWGVLASIGLDSGIVVRILFYFPGVALSLIAPALLARYLKFGRIVAFFASLVYSLNTYFVLLVDGGQIGVVLAYGLFPLALLMLLKFLDKPSRVLFYSTLFVFFLLCSADIRIGLIALLSLGVWKIVEFVTGAVKITSKQVLYLGLVVFFFISLSMYWLLPTFTLLSIDGLAGSTPDLQVNSLLTSLFLFQPHWYLNEFGKVAAVPFYFAGIPFLLFGSLWTGRKKNFTIALCVLLFAFLSKGATPPLGLMYQWAIDHLPMGVAFRDSTKFFLPLVLFGGILIGLSAEWLFAGIAAKNKRVGIMLLVSIYAYLLALGSPAIFGKLNGVLAARVVNEDVVKVNSHLISEPGFFRVAWFPEHNPFSVHTLEKQIVEAKVLVDKRPLAALNAGIQDRFNFLHDPHAIDWFRLFGIKYLVFSGDPRKASLNEEEKYDWNNLLNLVDSTEGLKKLDIGYNIPVYEVPNTKPHIFASDKLFIVVGGDDIYQKIRNKNANFSPENQPFLFAEDGKWVWQSLSNIASDSAVIVMNEKHDEDLAFSLLQKYFISPSQKSEWAVRRTGDYLRYKYELLINNMDFYEFDYGKGVAFSTKKGEKVYFDLPVPDNGSYILAYRTWDGNHFQWVISQPQDFKKGVYHFDLENTGGVKVVNVAALVPKNDWDRAWRQKEELTNKFTVVSVGEEELNGLEELISNSWERVNEQQINPTKYTLNVPDGKRWIVFSDSFNTGWLAQHNLEETSALPFYSAINGFYAPSGGDWTLEFSGQRYVVWGMLVSGATLILLILLFIFRKNYK